MNLGSIPVCKKWKDNWAGGEIELQGRTSKDSQRWTYEAKMDPSELSPTGPPWPGLSTSMLTLTGGEPL